MISSQHNQYLELAHKLKLKKYRDREKLFLLEGCRAVEEGARAGRLRQVFLREGAQRPTWLEADGLAGSYRVDEVAAAVFPVLTSTQTPAGIVAIAAQGEWDFSAVIAAARQLVYLDRIADPGNLGTIMRSALALSADALLLSPGCADPYNDKAVRASMGAILHLPVFTAMIDLSALTRQGFTLTAADVRAARYHYEYVFQEKEVLLIGSEAAGLSAEIKAAAAQLIKIPLDPRAESLNAAVSCAIILAEAGRQRAL
jgi:TrmH family RNA methyltransferase